MSYQSHTSSAAGIIARCAIVTLSDSRTAETDISGQRIREMLEERQHTVAACQLLPDEPSALESRLREYIVRPDIDVIITNGGTGISRRDQTIAVIARLLTQHLTGFGELFRMLSYEQIGSGAMISQAIGGVVRANESSAKLIFALPGSPKAVELAMTKLILPELKHLIAELRK